MEESVLVVAHVDKGGIQSGHELFGFGQIDVAHGVGYVAGLLLQGDQA